MGRPICALREITTLASIFGLIMALYYLRFGRVAPLILAHYLTNALQVIVTIVRMG